jgi:hypothetical protein
MTSLGKPDVPFTERGAMIDRVRTTIEPLEAMVARYDAQNAPAAVPDPQSAIAKLQMDFNNGLITQEQLQIGMQNLAPTGMVVESTPGGGVRIVQGVGVGADVGTFEPADPLLMIQNIDAILNDPGLPYATGADGPTRSRSPIFSEAFRVGTRMDQLEGQAFLQAFEALKGAGQITEIEGQKATMAVGRLNRGMSEEDYRAALLELRGVLQNAAQRPQGWANTPEGQAASQAVQPPPAAPPPLGDSQFVPVVPSSGVGTPAGAPPVTVNANGPAFTGPITAEAIRTMTPMQYAEWAALNAARLGELPDDVLDAIIARGE